MKRRLPRKLTLALPLALLGTWLPGGPTAAAPLRSGYVVVANGETVGRISVVRDGGALDIDYAVSDNGRGPKHAEQLQLDPAGIPTSWSIDGASLMGGPVHERFAWTNGVARWTSQADHGERPAERAPLYVADDASPYALALYAKRLLRTPGLAMDALPGGRLRLGALGPVTVHGAGPLQAYVLNGAELTPDILLLDRNGELFAKLGSEIVVREGHEDQREALRKLGEALTLQILQRMQAQVSHAYDAPIRLRNVRIFEPATLSLGPPSSVVVFRGRVTTVEPTGADLDPHPDEVTIDGQGGTLVAGLHDMHAHNALWSGPFYLAAGVTTTRDMGNVNSMLLDLTRRLDAGVLPGPHIIPSGFLEGRSPYSARNGFIPETLDEGLKDVRWYADRGYIQIKIYNSMTPDWVKPLAVEAHGLGLRVVGHVPAFTTPDHMIESGYDEITHVNQLMLGWLLKPGEDTRTPLRLTALQRAADLDLDSAPVQHTFALMREHGTGLGAMRGAPDLVELGKDDVGQDRFTTRDMIEAEQRLHRAAAMMAERERHEVSGSDRGAALAHAADRGLVLSGEQADALAHVTDGRGLGIVVGYAGTGKSAMLGVAREAWEDAGYTVRGVALSGIAAENLEGGSGIASRTIASMEHGWSQGRDLLTSRDVLVIDEAGMVGTRQMERVLSHAAEAGAKVVLVGDPQQLQSIEAGAAFRSIHDHHGGAEISEVRRQREDWQRDATRDLATSRTGDAIHAYEQHGMVHSAETREQARSDLIDRWDRERQANPDASRIILTHTNAKVRELNEAARDRMREAGNLGKDMRVTVERGARTFAPGDRVMFLANECGLGVKNGTLGTVEQVSAQSMTVHADDGRAVAFDLKDYNKIDHGYAATIHKAQGMTVDRAHVLATPGMDAHGSYVALSRHRDGMDLHYGRDDFAGQDKLINTLSRDRAKDMASDYEPARAYAERRGITFRERVERVVEIVRQVPEKVRGMFDGLRLPAEGGQGPERKVEEDPEAALRRARGRALVRHARAVDAIFAAQDQGSKASPDQVRELQEARLRFEEVRPYGSHDAEAAYKKNPELAAEAASGDARRAIRALQLETGLRTEPARRADRFVERWQSLHRASDEQYAAGDYAGHRAARAEMGNMAHSLERDPQMESLLAGRKRELGISFDSGMGVGRDLTLTFGLGRGRGLGL